MEFKNIDNKNIVENVVRDSIGEELGIEPNDEILSVNGKLPKDIIDYKYLINDEYVELEIKKTDGEIILFEIEKDFNEDLGLEFTNPLIDQAKTCRNKCIFCFIDQLPPDMRETLYFKDDDSRLSFLQGNFITLTNMSEEEIERIIKYHISPINVSVHTTNPELRCSMLNNKNAGKLMDILKRFDEANLIVNCQIVCVPGVNDEDELERTIEDLYSLRNSVQSVAIVPVGVTKHREKLFEVEVFDREKSIYIVEQVHWLQKRYLEDSGTRFVFLGDEFYILAGRDLPSEVEYEGYPQIENGVGLVRSFYEEFKDGLLDLDKNQKNTSVTLATGTLAFDFMKRVSDEISPYFPNMSIKTKAIINNFFGDTITVAGLVTGGDLIEQLKEDESSAIMIPICMLKQDTEIFLDDVTISDVEKALNKKVYVAEVDGYEFIRMLSEEVK